MTFLTSPLFMPLQTLLFLTTWLTLHHHIHKTCSHTPLPFARAFTTIHNRLYSLLSFLLLLFILLYPYTHDQAARLTYHLSKFYEYIDILAVCASGGHIGWHFGVHHSTTPWLTYIRVLPGGMKRWRWFAGANAAHHGVMYGYFGGLWGDDSNSNKGVVRVKGETVRGVLRWTGRVQLVVGVLVDAWCLGEGWLGAFDMGIGEEWWRYVVSMGLLGVYGGLMEWEERGGRKKKRREIKGE